MKERKSVKFFFFANFVGIFFRILEIVENPPGKPLEPLHHDEGVAAPWATPKHVEIYVRQLFVVQENVAYHFSNQTKTPTNRISEQ